MHRLRRFRVLLDCDGLLSNFTEGALQVVKRVTGRHYFVEDVTRYDFCEALGLSPTIARRCKDAIGATRGFCASLAVYPGAVEGVARLRELADVRIVTSPWNSNETWMSEREAWLRKHFGIPHEHVYHLSEKYAVHGDLLADDKVRNVREWSEEWPGKIAVFWRTPHNSGDAVPVGAHSIASWDALARLVEHEVVDQRSLAGVL